MPLVKTWQLTAGAAVAGLALSVAAVAAAGPWDSGQRKAERDAAASWGLTGGADHGGTAGAGSLPQAAPSAPGVLGAVGPGVPRGQAAPAGAADGLAARLRPLLADPALGTVRTASVVDTATGQVLYDSGAREAMTPASTVKIATAAAVLAALGPEHRIRTTVVPGTTPGQIVLVGGGDPSLTAKKKSPAGSGGSLVALAADAAQALKAAGNRHRQPSGTTTAVYTGPARHPIGMNPNIAPVTALAAGRGPPRRLHLRARGPHRRPLRGRRPRLPHPAGGTRRQGHRGGPSGPRPPPAPSRWPSPSPPRWPGSSNGC
ncbi:D-alanyl-D-alanine carboxypeptidase [Streptomyces virginiae]|uniref:D-alanyl-D-alanine carboxypeptidase n=1 Tax=Streptomyces virginiae TaxID=1961 RepID=UPI0027E4ECA8|nr:D-alanyl-D-alanine carboxypeptidase [Streptomyces virginiae]